MVSLLGLIRSDAIVLVIGIAATLAGIGFYGSSRSTLIRSPRKSEPMKRVVPR